MEKYPPYQPIFSKLSYGESQMLDKAFYEEEVKRLCLSFEQQVNYKSSPCGLLKMASLVQFLKSCVSKFTFRD